MAPVEEHLTKSVLAGVAEVPPLNGLAMLGSIPSVRQKSYFTGLLKPPTSPPIVEFTKS